MRSKILFLCLLNGASLACNESQKFNPIFSLNKQKLGQTFEPEQKTVDRAANPTQLPIQEEEDFIIFKDKNGCEGIKISTDLSCAHVNHSQDNKNSHDYTQKFCEVEVNLKTYLTSEQMLNGQLSILWRGLGYRGITSTLPSKTYSSGETSGSPTKPCMYSNSDITPDLQEKYTFDITKSHSFNRPPENASSNFFVPANSPSKWWSVEYDYNVVSNKLRIANRVNGWGKCSTASKSTHYCAACLSDIQIIYKSADCSHRSSP